MEIIINSESMPNNVKQKLIELKKIYINIKKPFGGKCC